MSACEATRVKWGILGSGANGAGMPRRQLWRCHCVWAVDTRVHMRPRHCGAQTASAGGGTSVGSDTVYMRLPCDVRRFPMALARQVSKMKVARCQRLVARFVSLANARARQRAPPIAPQRAIHLKRCRYTALRKVTTHTFSAVPPLIYVHAFPLLYNI